jgi:hypothetical protein
MYKYFTFFFNRIFYVQAINSPGAETEKSAWEALIPAVEQLKDFYEFSLELGKCTFIPQESFIDLSVPFATPL